jgi:hypothetical protein
MLDHTQKNIISNGFIRQQRNIYNMLDGKIEKKEKKRSVKNVDVISL